MAAPLRKLPSLEHLELGKCEVGDEGMASLVADLGDDHFEALEGINLYGNMISDEGAAMLVSAIDAGGLPSLQLSLNNFFMSHNPASDDAIYSVREAVAKRSGRQVFRV